VTTWHAPPSTTRPAASAEQVVDRDTWTVQLTLDPRRLPVALTWDTLEVTLDPDQARTLFAALDAALVEPDLCRWCHNGTLARYKSGLCDAHEEQA